MKKIKLRETKDTLILVKTKKEYDTLMKLFEKKGWKWNDGQMPTGWDGWAHGWGSHITMKNRFTRGNKPHGNKKVIPFGQLKDSGYNEDPLSAVTSKSLRLYG